MWVTHCYVCDRQSGFARRLGWGTFFMVILTAGFWLLAIPFYPKRCTTCGCTEGGAARASLALASGPPSRERQLLTAYGIIGAFVLVVLLIWLANLEPSKTVPIAPASTQTVSNIETTESAAPAPPLRGRLRLTVDESLESPREITFFIGPGIPQTGSVFLANGYLVNPKSQMRIPRMDLLCIVSQPNCYALIPGMTYGADAVKQGEADYVRTVPLALTPLYACIRIYGPDHVYLYAAGTNKIVGIPTLDEAASLPPVEEPAERPRYEQPAHAYVPPVQYAPSAQAPVETPAFSIPAVQHAPSADPSGSNGTPASPEQALSADIPSQLGFPAGVRLMIRVNSIIRQSDGSFTFRGSLLLPVTLTGAVSLDQNTRLAGSGAAGGRTALVKEFTVSGETYELQAANVSNKRPGSGPAVELDPGKVLEMWFASASVYEKTSDALPQQ